MMLEKKIHIRRPQRKRVALYRNGRHAGSQDQRTAFILKKKKKNYITNVKIRKKKIHKRESKRKQVTRYENVSHTRL